MGRPRRRRPQDRPARSTCGPSAVVPYVPGEYRQARHRRRFAAALAGLSGVRAWCAANNVALTLKGQPARSVWGFTAPGRFAVWLPYAGRLNLKRDLRAGQFRVIACYDTAQLLARLAWWLAGSD